MKGSTSTLFYLFSNKSETLPLESKVNITTIAMSPNGNLMLLVNEGGLLVSCCMLVKCHQLGAVCRSYIISQVMYLGQVFIYTHHI